MDPRERIFFVLFIGQTVTSGGHVARSFYNASRIVRAAFAFLRLGNRTLSPDFTDDNYKGQMGGTIAANERRRKRKRPVPDVLSKQQVTKGS